jgi:glutamine amidotransferase
MEGPQGQRQQGQRVTNPFASVGLVDYQSGNLLSISNAVEHLGARVSRVHRGTDIGGLTHLVLPGVGAFGYCMGNLANSGVIPLLERWVLDDKPLLGICVGMQLLADFGEEGNGCAGLGWLGGVVGLLQTADPSLRVPHVGWNSVTFDTAFGTIPAGASADFYFDHSYALGGTSDSVVVGRCTHGASFPAVVRKGNLVGAQFHPEKSQGSGMRFLSGFLGIGAAGA